MSGHDLEQTFVERSLADLAAAAPARDDGESSGHSALSPAALTSVVPPSVALPSVAPPPAAPLFVAHPYPPPPNTRPIVGQTRLGSCLVTDIIGDGGMATVYRVWNEPLEVFRAVKLLSRVEHRGRFETEAKITAKLSHEGIVDIHSIGEWNGTPYMEMALVDGPTLQRILAERGKLPEIVCAAIAALVAKALAYAHSETYMLAGQEYCGIIHRDLKPANIMITASGAVKLIDFGIARPTQASLHTMEGNIAGTMYYLSPEQMDGGEVDNRSDIYSLGTILYEMATGAKTFPQESITELMKRKSSNKFKSPHEFSVNTNLANIIHRCLRRTPAKRYQHAQELADDLQKFCETMTRQAPTAILENFFSGAEEAIYADFGQAKTQRRSPRKWFLDKFNASGTPPKPPKEKLPV
ncbi:MAG: serine/threonine protein kinase, partial [Chitinispirillales bacterium]|nr:serine/threonine protein kinase [Chitinispirillales bacterium]